MHTPDFMRRRFLLAIFVVSGFTGLIYESIWSHYLRLFLGHAAYAQTLVLAIFMGGMALGSWAVARYSLHIRRLLWAYVLVETLIGILGLVFHPTFVGAANVSFATVIPALPSVWLIQMYKWLLASLLILPQSVLLGMTFPLISGGLIRRWPDQPGRTLATLYFTNSLGAGIGVLVSGFVLISAVGLPGTIVTAGVLNIALAAAVWAVIRDRPEPVPESRATNDPRPVTSELARWLTVAAFLSGTASFMYELGWIRMLSLVLGSSTHSFELMLSAFILGLAFGGLYVRRRIGRVTDPLSYLGYVFVAMGTLAALTLPAYNLTFDAMAWFLDTFKHTPQGYAAFNLTSQLIAALIMIPATFCAGMTLPLLTHELMRRGGGERAIGWIYSANTLGAIAGVLVTIHVLMPEIGVKGVILAGAGIHIALGLSRLVARDWRAMRGKLVPAALGLAVFGFVAFVVSLDRAKMASGVYRTGSASLPEGASVVYLRDGKTATISLIQRNGTVTIATNGKPDASVQMGPGRATIDESTMVLAAAIPLSMHAHPARVANIGFGSGLTTHTLLTSPRIKRLDSIEIEPLMVEAALAGFGPRIANVFEDPRSHIVYEDAKTYFAAVPEPYDLIVSEPSNPWVSGVATLFSDEFYGHITAHLAPDGYFVQWIQVYETNLDVVASVMKALAPHFGAYALYNTDDFDMLIVATRGPTLPQSEDALLQSPELHVELERIGVQSVADIRSRKIGDSVTLGPLLQSIGVPANSDYYPFVDLNAPRLRYLGANALELPALTLLPLPFAELVSGAVRQEPTADPAPNSTLVRDHLVQRAVAIHDAVMSANLDGLDPFSARYLWMIGASAEQCAEESTQRAWQEAVRNISDDTAAYLSAAEAGEIWKRVLSSPCYSRVPENKRTWVELFVAIAQRDAAQIARLGSGLIAQRSASQEDLTYLTTVTAAAYVGLGQSARARSLLQREWPDLKHAAPFDLALRELLALTHVPQLRAIAQARP
jgi:spermidine synthase